MKNSKKNSRTHKFIFIILYIVTTVVFFFIFYSSSKEEFKITPEELGSFEFINSLFFALLTSFGINFFIGRSKNK